MPQKEFFERFGLFGVEHFLDADLCRELRAAFQAGLRRAATVGPELVVDRTRRSVDWVTLDESLVSRVHDRLGDVKPVLEGHYHMALAGWQKPQFLAYRTGDYYTPHVDAGSSDVSKVRRLSAVIFLNNRAETAVSDHYGGGALTFYGLFESPTGAMPGIPLEASEGLLITFPSDLLHGVAAVTHGERYSIATWYF